MGMMHGAREAAAVEVRAAVPGDAPALADILTGIGWFPRVTAADEAAEFVARVAELVPSIEETGQRVMPVAELGGEVVGYAHLHRVPLLFLAGPEAYLTELFVVERARGRGIGGRLLDEVVEAAAGWGASRVSLLNHRGRESYRRGFYPAHGFEEATPLAVLRRSLA